MSFPPSASRTAGWTRFRPPRRQSGHVDRPRVQALIDKSVSTERVTVVTAPSGFGKTSAVSAWAAGKPGRVAWLSLGAFDADPLRLGTGIIQALQSLVRSGSGDADILTIDPESRDVGRTLEALTDALEGSREQAYLVVDDAHRAGEALSTGLLGALIDAGPDPLRLIVVGTSYVELALARWGLTHPEALIRADQLAFDLDEIATIPAVDQGRLAPETVLEETQGWPIAIRFVQMTRVQPRTRRGTDEDLLRDYVRDQVLGSLPAHLARFVLDTSICTDLTADLASAVSGRDDAAALLGECARLGLFIDRYDTDRGAVYRWHSIFARQCRTILEILHPGRRTQVHRAAGTHLEAIDPLTSVSHWLDADDPAAAVRVILTRWVGVVVGSEAAALDRICATLPAHYADDPSILLVRACAQDVTGAHDVARILLARADAQAGASPPGPEYDLNLPRAHLFLLDDRAAATKASARVEAQLQTTDGTDLHDRAAVLYLLGWTEMRHRSNPERAIQFLSTAAREADAIGDLALNRRALGHLAFVLAWAGELTHAAQILEELGDRVDDDSPWLQYAGGGAATAAGCIAYWGDDLARAERELSRAIRGGAKASFAGIARMVLAFTAAAAKDPHACRRAALELQAIPQRAAQGVSWPAYRHASLAALAEAAGHRDRALAIAARYAEADDLPLVSVMLAGIVRRSGDSHLALQMLRRLTRYEGISYVRVATLVTAAIVQRRHSNLELTHDLCEQALEIAERENVRRPFCDGDLEMRQLLTEHLAWGSRNEDFIARCLTPRTMHGPLRLLSERERTVFEQLRTTKTMSEIAESLDLSINTIKTHQRSIYRKLGVTSRREAVRFA